MKGIGLVKGLGVTLKHFFRREITEQYPDVMPELPERYRGRLQFDPTKCIACGQCINVCPNNVLSMETFRDANTKKRKLTSFTIDFQYCMICNLCVEACPVSTLYFNQDFELSVADRNAIKMTYDNLSGEVMEQGAVLITPEGSVPATADEPEKIQQMQEQAEREQRQITAMITAMAKNPHKILARVVEGEEDLGILADLVGQDEKIAAKIAELLVKDKEKAARVAAGFIKKEAKRRNEAISDKKGEE